MTDGSSIGWIIRGEEECLADIGQGRIFAAQRANGVYWVLEVMLGGMYK